MKLKELLTMISNIRPKAVHLLVFEAGEGKTCVKSTYNPRGWLLMMNAAGCMTHRWKAIDTPYAEEIASAIAGRLKVAQLDAFGPWFAAEYDFVMRIVDEYDFTTGRPLVDIAYGVGARVLVRDAGCGCVRSFRNGHLVVKLDKPLAEGVNTVIAPKAIVKPVVRLAVGGGAPANP